MAEQERLEPIRLAKKCDEMVRERERKNMAEHLARVSCQLPQIAQPDASNDHSCCCCDRVLQAWKGPKPDLHPATLVAVELRARGTVGVMTTAATGTGECIQCQVHNKTFSPNARCLWAQHF